MIARHGIKKLLILTAIFVSVFGSLQLNFVQHNLLGLMNTPGLNVQFGHIEGFFPINCSLYDISIRTNDIQIDVNRLKFSLSKRMFHVKHFEIDKAKVKQLKDTKLYPSDFKFFIPILMQKIVKKAKFHEIDIAGEKITDILLSYNRKSNSTTLSLTSSMGKSSAQWKFEGEMICGTARLGDCQVDVSFNRLNNKLRVVSLGAVLDGTIGDKCFTGTLRYAGYQPKIKILTKNEFIKVKFNERKFRVSGKIDYDLDKLVASIYDVKIGTNITLSPITIDKELKVSDFSAIFPKGQIDFRGIDFAKERFSLGTLFVKDVDMSQIDQISSLKGLLNGVGKYEHGTGTFALTVKNLEYIGLSIPNIEISSEYSNEKLALKASTEILKEKQQVDVTANMKDWTIEGIARGGIDIQNYKVASGQRVRGKLKYQVKVSGNLKEPNITGNVSLLDGVYVNLVSGTYIRDITLLGTLKTNILDIKKIYARDDSKIGGTISGSGRIRYADNSLNTNIGLKVDKFKAVDQKWLNARLFGNLTLVGDLLQKIKIKGDLYVEKPTIDVSGIVLLSMRSTDLIAKKKIKQQSMDVIRVKFPTDIRLSVRPELKISGFGLNSGWDAEAKVTGDLMNPGYAFMAKLKSGTIELTDNAFKLKDGSVLMDNADTNIHVSAEKIIDKITVGAKFIQKAGQSKVDFYSNPYMSDKDVMSYMLFDKNASEISMGEAMSLLSVMTKLAGGADFNILGRMKTIFGIDTISVKKNKNLSGEEYDTVSLGKKIGKFKVSVDQATGRDGTDVVVEADVAKNTKVSVDLSSKDSFGGGILWSKRY